MRRLPETALGRTAGSTHLALTGAAARRVIAGLSGALVWLLSAPVVLGASPTPSRPPSTDTRSALEGPGFVGSPELAILGVVAIAIVAIVATLLYVRLTSGSGNRTP